MIDVTRGSVWALAVLVWSLASWQERGPGRWREQSKERAGLGGGLASEACVGRLGLAWAARGSSPRSRWGELGRGADSKHICRRERRAKAEKRGVSGAEDTHTAHHTHTHTHTTTYVLRAAAAGARLAGTREREVAVVLCLSVGARLWEGVARGRRGGRCTRLGEERRKQQWRGRAGLDSEVLGSRELGGLGACVVLVRWRPGAALGSARWCQEGIAAKVQGVVAVRECERGA